jgi:hypothetical protein
MCNIRRCKAQCLQMATEERLQLVGLPANHRELFNQVGRELDITNGRVELIFNDGSFVDGYKQVRIRPLEAEHSPIYCACIINTTTVRDLCVVCGRPKRD